MKKEYLAPAIQVIALDNTSPILAGSGLQSISYEDPHQNLELVEIGTCYIDFGKGKCDDPE